MKVLLIVLVTLFSILYLHTDASAATVAWPTSDPSLPEIHMQVLVRNADGVLVAYFEPTLWYIADLNGIHALLDTKEQKTLVHKGGNSYERIRFTNHFTIPGTLQITSEPLYYNGKQVLMPRHDGVILKKDYTIDVYWNILRVAR